MESLEPMQDSEIKLKTIDEKSKEAKQQQQNPETII